MALSVGFVVPQSLNAQSYDDDAGTFTYLEGHPPAMQMAITEARASLTKALAETKRGWRGFDPALSLKVAVPFAEGNENIWIESISRTANGFVGVFANQPVHIEGKNLGDRIKFTENQIIDWAISGLNGRLFGHFTTRAILPNLPKEQAATISQILSTNPLPNWN